MSIETTLDASISTGLLRNYFRNLVNQVYKILPMREKEVQSIQKYIWRLESELLGFHGLVDELREDAYYGRLLSIMHYLSEHAMECEQEQVKQLVFESISVCEKLAERYAKDGE